MDSTIPGTDAVDLIKCQKCKYRGLQNTFPISMKPGGGYLKRCQTCLDKREAYARKQAGTSSKRTQNATGDGSSAIVKCRLCDYQGRQDSFPLKLLARDGGENSYSSLCQSCIEKRRPHWKQQSELRKEHRQLLKAAEKTPNVVPNAFVPAKRIPSNHPSLVKFLPMDFSETRWQALSEVYVTDIQTQMRHIQNHAQGRDAAVWGSEEDLPYTVFAPYSIWSPAEKNQFFHAVTRHSRFRPDLIAAEVRTKTEVEVMVFLEALGAAKSRRPAEGLVFEPAIRLDDSIIQQEEILSSRLEHIERGVKRALVQDEDEPAVNPTKRRRVMMPDMELHRDRLRLVSKFIRSKYIPTPSLHKRLAAEGMDKDLMDRIKADDLEVFRLRGVAKLQNRMAKRSITMETLVQLRTALQRWLREVIHRSITYHERPTFPSTQFGEETLDVDEETVKVALDAYREGCSTVYHPHAVHHVDDYHPSEQFNAGTIQSDDEDVDMSMWFEDPEEDRALADEDDKKDREEFRRLRRRYKFWSLRWGGRVHRMQDWIGEEQDETSVSLAQDTDDDVDDDDGNYPREERGMGDDEDSDDSWDEDEDPEIRRRVHVKPLVNLDSLIRMDEEETIGDGKDGEDGSEWEDE